MNPSILSRPASHMQVYGIMDSASEEACSMPALLVSALISQQTLQSEGSRAFLSVYAYPHTENGYTRTPVPQPFLIRAQNRNLNYTIEPVIIQDGLNDEYPLYCA
jgi:hypothetical protein